LSARRLLGRLAGAALLCAGATVDCAATPDPGQVTVVVTPDFAAFAGDANNAGVHTFLEKRCGTLDCHGQTGRPFRLFSSGGLRLLNDAGLTSGAGTDTAQEIYANYQALVGLQPEETSRVVNNEDPPSSLLVVAKPLGLQTHKGGQALAPNDSGDLCLEGWLMNKVDMAACNDAAQEP